MIKHTQPKEKAMNVSELSGAALDWAVAKCEQPDTGYKAWVQRDLDAGILHGMRYSTDWLFGGPIIEREWLQLTPWPNESDEGKRWHCVQHDARVQCHAFGPTPLIAAMRCYVASKLGDEVEIPELTVSKS